MEKQDQRNVNLRINILMILVYVIGFILLSQLINLQLINGDKYRSQSSSRLTRETKTNDWILD